MEGIWILNRGDTMLVLANKVAIKKDNNAGLLVVNDGIILGSYETTRDAMKAFDQIVAAAASGSNFVDLRGGGSDGNSTI